MNEIYRPGTVRKIRNLLIAFLGAGFLFGGVPYFHAAAAAALAPSKCSEALIEHAEQRISAVYDRPASSPIRLCIERPFLGLNTTHGTSRFAPFLPAINIMGPQGLNIDIVAHEWLHSEIAHQTGFITRNYRLPTWFDEGLAMQVDFRPEFSVPELRRYVSDQGLSVPSLKEMATAKQFFKRGRQGRLHYALARCVVFEEIQSASREHPHAAKSVLHMGLMQASFKKPEEFEAAYQLCVSGDYAKLKTTDA